MLTQQPFRVVLTDYFAPSGDGLALLRYIRQTIPGTPGILMAAFGAPALRQAALAEGAYAYLAKPFRLQDLWDVVQPALQGLPAPGANRSPEAEVRRKVTMARTAAAPQCCRPVATPG